MDWAAEDLRRRGFAVWNIDYRGVDRPGGGYPGTFLDVAAAADALAGHARELHLDTRRVVAVGHSAGGHLALWLAGRRHLPRSSPLTDATIRFAGVVSLGGLPDLERDAGSRTAAAQRSAHTCRPDILPRPRCRGSRRSAFGNISSTGCRPDHPYRDRLRLSAPDASRGRQGDRSTGSRVRTFRADRAGKPRLGQLAVNAVIERPSPPAAGNKPVLLPLASV